MGEMLQMVADVLGSGGIGIAAVVIVAYYKKDRQLEKRNDQILKLHETRAAADAARDMVLNSIEKTLTIMAAKI